MTAYQTVVVGTDGSESSLRAVDRAAAIASESNAKLIITTGYFPHKDDLRAADALGEEGYKVRGNAPIYALLREARDRAMAAGAKKIEERPIQDAPVDALVDLRQLRSLEQLTGDAITPLLDAMARGELRELRLDFEDGACFRIHRGQRWHFWKKPLAALRDE